MIKKKTIPELEKELKQLQAKKKQYLDKKDLELKIQQLKKEINALKYSDFKKLGNQLLGESKKAKCSIKQNIQKYYKTRAEKRKRFMEWYNKLTPEQQKEYQRRQHIW